MLSRYNSEFQWYRERIGPVQHHLKGDYPTQDMATERASLNAEPADPQERDRKHLPPKSYADAAHEALEETQQNGDGHGMSDVSAHTAMYDPVSNSDGRKGDEQRHKMVNGHHDHQDSDSKGAVSKSRLKTGREAGRGWRESAYVPSTSSCFKNVHPDI